MFSSILSQFTKWRHYEHRVLANVDGKLVPIPINLDTVNMLYGLNLTTDASWKLLRGIGRKEGTDPNFRGCCRRTRVGRELYEKMFRGYTRKQWGWTRPELDASVTARIPVRTNRDDRYFTDTYQAMPLHGYTRMFENMLDHPNIKIAVNTDYRDISAKSSSQKWFTTGPVDEFFDIRYGKAAVPLAGVQARDARAAKYSSLRRS